MEKLMFSSHSLRVKQIVHLSASLGLKWPFFLYHFFSYYDKQIRLTYCVDVNNSVISNSYKKKKKNRLTSTARVWFGCQGRISGCSWKKWMDSCRLLEGLEHEELLEDLGLAGLPDFPCQEHLIHHCVDL